MTSRSWKWWPLVAICLGTVMLLVDVTIVNVALPHMAAGLHTSFTALQWVVDIYALAVAALLLGAGSTGDRIGHRTVYLGGLVGFALASAASGLAPNAAVLVVSRGVQGVAGAAMFATTFALLSSSYQGRDRGTAYGIWGAISGASAALGPIAGGLLTEHLSWRWIFYVNLPICALAIGLTLLVLPRTRPTAAARVDLAGVATFTVAAGAVTFALIRSGEDGWTATSSLLLAGLALVAAIAFVLIERRVTSPALDLNLLRHKSFVAALLAALALNFGAFANLAYLSLWLQSVLSLSPVQAGLVTVPLSGGAFLISAAIGRHLHGARPGPVIAGGLAAIGAGALAQAWLGAGSTWIDVLPGLLLVGIGVGLATPTLSSTAMAAVPHERGGMAAGAVNTGRQLGFAVGIAVLGSVFRGRAGEVLRDHGVPQAHDVAGALAGGQAASVVARTPAPARPAVTEALRAAAAGGLDAALILAGAVALLAALTVAVLLRPRPEPALAAEPATQLSVSS